MSLLTLIILGEGIIGLTKSISYIVKNANVFSSAIIGNIVAAILIIYFLFLIYFHRLQEHHIGTIKQQIWSFLHFPFHVCLVLALEGSRQLILWRQGIQLARDLTGQIAEVVAPYDLDVPQPADVYQDLYDSFNSIAYDYTFYYSPKGFDISGFETKFDNTLETFYNISMEVADGTSTATEEISTTILNMWSVLSDAVFAMIGIAVEEDESSDESEPNAAAEAIEDPKWGTLFALVYGYTFISAGLALIIMGVLGLISHHPKTPGGWIRAAVTLAVGLGVTLLSIMVVSDALGDYLGSPWVLPTLVFAFFIVVVTDNIRRR
jgi:low temperature requirement protein LtrA